MGLNTFATGLAGLNSNSQGLNVVGNNLANLNTVGFKSSNISFSEVLGQLGSQVSGIRATFSQGGLQSSNNALDVAIQGRGFLVMSDGGARYYTRSGSLNVDAEGNLVGENGLNVQGYTRNPTTGEIDQNLGVENIQIPTGLIAPMATTEFELGMNLDGNAASGARFSATVLMYDSQGKAHNATLSMVKDISTGTPAVTRWRYDLTIPRNEVAGVPATNTGRLSLITGLVATDPPAAGAMVFDSDGQLTSVYTGSDPDPLPDLENLTIPPDGVTLPQLSNGATLSEMTWKVLSDAGTPNITGFANASEMNLFNQNGAAPGSISSISVEPDGTLAAVFSNGRTLDVGQIALATFSNMDGLVAQGGGLYTESRSSGASRIGAPGDSGRGRLMGGALEQSNVDLASELTKIITFQRGYQANARIITTTDQILQETMQLMQ